jgi:glycosyltransferase involved in cell wall biosynthesis
MLITTLTFGGAEIQVVNLAIALKRLGWRTKVICMVDPDAYVGLLAPEGIEVESLGMQRGIPDLRAIWKLRRHVLQFRPHVLHCHMVHANLLGRVARIFCRIPVLVCTVHNIQERSEKGGGTWYKEFLYRVTDFLADRTTVICNAAFNRYVHVGAVPRQKLEVVPNGIDTAQFAPSMETRAADRLALGLQDDFVWLAAGRLVEQKNYDLLLRALTLLPEKRWTLLLAGSGPLQQELKSQCDRLGLNDRVRFLGALEDLRHLYNAADAFVMSSRYEGLSVALLEAASMGLPSVVTNVGGNSDVVLDGITGTVVKSDDHVELGRAMLALQQAPAQTRSLAGKAAREHCVRHYRFEAVVDQWTSLYKRYIRGQQSDQPSTLVAVRDSQGGFSGRL